ncbi:uncharacterized membrane protein YgaE (UPF0421/DUF939 family) [Streptococcus rupicaprae]|uniref:Uncharacterized membrane protein YgaE (UPF0421/DUF939 family) n=1 Tax=Streptococcus rupicaprae TaxID=759619 RepID=A0ABV2FGR0_9STRE
MKKINGAFLGIGLAFLVIGLSGQTPVFSFVGVTFMALTFIQGNGTSDQ